MKGKQVLVIGSGGREHAICWKLSQSTNVSKIFALPGSFGISQVEKCENVQDVDPKKFEVSIKIYNFLCCSFTYSLNFEKTSSYVMLSHKSSSV